MHCRIHAVKPIHKWLIFLQEVQLHMYLLQAPVPLERLRLFSFTSGSFDAGPLQGHGRGRGRC